MTLFPFDYNPHGYPCFSLKEDSALRREMVAAMRDRAVSISLGEVFAVQSGHGSARLGGRSWGDGKAKPAEPEE